MFALFSWLSGSAQAASPRAPDYSALLCTEIKQRIIDFVEPRDAIALLRVNHSWRHAVTDRVPLHGLLTKAGVAVRPDEAKQAGVREGTALQLRDALLAQRRCQLQRQRGGCAVSAIALPSHPAPDPHMRLSPDATFAVVTTTQTGATLLCLRNKSLRAQPLNVRAATPRGVAFSPSGKQLAIVDSPLSVRLYQLRGDEVHLQTRLQTERAYQELLFSPDGSTLIMADGLGTMARWNVAEANVHAHAAVFSMPLGGIRTWTFSDDSTHLAASSSNQTLRIFDMSAATPRVLATIAGHPPASTLAFSQDNTHLVTGASGGMTRLFELAKPAKAKLFLDNNRAAVVRLTAFVDDDRKLLTVGSNGCIQLCDWRSTSPRIAYVDAGTQLECLSAHVSPDKQLLTTLGYNPGYSAVKTWDLTQPMPVAKVWRFPNEMLLDAQFSGDGRFVAAPSVQGNVHLCDFDLMRARKDAVRMQG